MASALRRHDPSARITFVVQEYTRDLVALCPDIDDVISIPSRDLRGGMSAFTGRLRELRLDAAIFAYPRPRLALAAWLARIPVRVGTAYRWYGRLFNARHAEHRRPSVRHEADYNLQLLSHLGIDAGDSPLPRPEVDEALRAQAAAALEESGIAPGRPFIVLHPGSGGSARDWPAARFAALARALQRQRPEFDVLITGSEEERDLMREVSEEGGDRTCMLALPLTLPQLAAVLQLAAAAVANSTGPLHLAAATGTPVLGLYPFARVCHPRRWGPLGPDSRVLMPHPEPGCADCAAGACERHDDMTRISVDAGMQVLGEMLQG